MSVYDTANFTGGVALAASYISHGRSSTRTFDTCFEMNDGTAVALTLYRRALRNPDDLPKWLVFFYDHGPGDPVRWMHNAYQEHDPICAKCRADPGYMASVAVFSEWPGTELAQYAPEGWGSVTTSALNSVESKLSYCSNNK